MCTMEETASALVRFIDETGIACYLAGDAARLLGVHRKTIARRCKRGQLTRIEHLGRIYIPVHEVQQQLQREGGVNAGQ